MRMLFPVIVGGFLLNNDVLGIYDCILTPIFLRQIEIKGAFEFVCSVMQDRIIANEFSVQRTRINNLVLVRRNFF